MNASFPLVFPVVMDCVDFWTCLLSRVETGTQFWHWSKVSKASATASRTVRHLVATKLTKLNLRRWGWSHSLKTPKMLLHGTRGVIDDDGMFHVKSYNFGKEVPGELMIVPYREPADLSPAVVKQLRSVSDDLAQTTWRRMLAQLPFEERKEIPVNPPANTIVYEVVGKFIEQRE